MEEMIHTKFIMFAYIVHLHILYTRTHNTVTHTNVHTVHKDRLISIHTHTHRYTHTHTHTHTPQHTHIYYTHIRYIDTNN